MESCALVGITKKCNTDNSLHLPSVKISAEKFLDKLLFTLKWVIEYTFGMHIGFAIGWLLGLCVGKVYVEHFRSVSLDDLSQLSNWRPLSHEFAKNAAIIGVVVGVIVIAIINSKLLSQRVIFLHKNGSTDPKDIAQALGKSTRQIERKIGKLIKKGRIGHKRSTDTHNHEILNKRETK